MWNKRGWWIKHKGHGPMKSYSLQSPIGPLICKFHSTASPTEGFLRENQTLFPPATRIRVLMQLHRFPQLTSDPDRKPGSWSISSDSISVKVNGSPTKEQLIIHINECVIAHVKLLYSRTQWNQVWHGGRHGCGKAGSVYACLHCFLNLWAQKLTYP